MQGLHLIADLQHCRCPLELLTDQSMLADICRNLIGNIGLTSVGEKYFTFPAVRGERGGVTGVVLLAESHLALHTWPEQSGVTLDLFVCNFTEDNSAKAEELLAQLIDRFAPAIKRIQRVRRGL